MVNFIFTTSLTEIKDALVKCYRRQTVSEENKSLIGKDSSVKSLANRQDDDSTDHE